MISRAVILGIARNSFNLKKEEFLQYIKWKVPKTFKSRQNFRKHMFQVKPIL